MHYRKLDQKQEPQALQCGTLRFSMRCFIPLHQSAWLHLRFLCGMPYQQFSVAVFYRIKKVLSSTFFFQISKDIHNCSIISLQRKYVDATYSATFNYYIAITKLHGYKTLKKTSFKFKLIRVTNTSTIFFKSFLEQYFCEQY